MHNQNIEHLILKQLEKVSRKNAVGNTPEPPWPTCSFIFHQPKRPKK